MRKLLRRLFVLLAFSIIVDDEYGIHIVRTHTQEDV